MDGKDFACDVATTGVPGVHLDRVPEAAAAVDDVDISAGESDSSAMHQLLATLLLAEE
jgi:hypothetical protein